ncbi:MAG: F0F1 ATP synthase subunit B [Bacteroidales bacterium]|nr:F0F1 ATP synthase subunit B [Bacteroidales bacterium]MDD6053319.1 F0F1 ATP synthase subunit B [Bacteroidales bacterium]
MSLVTPDFGLLVWMTLIFGIVLFILARFGFPVITRSVEARAERIRTTLDDLKKAEERMKVLAREQEELIARAKEERDAIISDANLTRRQIVSQAREEALAESERIVTKARQDIEHEKETALRELRGKVADLSMQIAGKVLRKSLDGDGEQLRYIDRLIDELSEQDK